MQASDKGATWMAHFRVLTSERSDSRADKGEASIVFEKAKDIRFDDSRDLKRSTKLKKIKELSCVLYGGPYFVGLTNSGMHSACQ